MRNKETVWRTPYVEIHIIERDDGTVEVNGSPVEPISVTIENLRAVPAKGAEVPVPEL